MKNEIKKLTQKIEELRNKIEDLEKEQKMFIDFFHQQEDYNEDYHNRLKKLEMKNK